MAHNDHNQPDQSRQPDDRTVTLIGRSTPEFERNLAEFRQWQADQRDQRDQRDR